MPFEIPPSWAWIMFGEICDYGSSDTASANQIADNAWCLDLEDIEKDTAKILAYITKAERPFTSTKHPFKRGQLLYSKLRPYLNKVVIAPKDGYCTSEILPLNFCITVYERYIRHVLMSQYFLAYTEKCSRGIKMPRLGTDDGKKALVPLPPLKEQKRIADAIEAQFELIAQIEAEQTDLQTYATLAKSKILDLAMRGKLVPQDPNDEPASELLARLSTSHKSHYEKLPKNWLLVTIGEVCEIRNGFTPLRSNNRFWDNGDIPWFTIDDIRTHGRVITKTRQYITNEATTVERIVPPNSVLLCCTASIGEYALTKIAITTNQQFNALSIKSKFTPCINPEFLFYVASTLKERLHRLAGATTFGFVSVKKLASLSFPVPTVAEQDRIVCKIKELFKHINLLCG